LLLRRRGERAGCREKNRETQNEDAFHDFCFPFVRTDRTHRNIGFFRADDFMSAQELRKKRKTCARSGSGPCPPR
jgi:hypothetical protein